MKKNKHIFLWCLSVLTLFFVLSCTKNKIEQEQVFDETNLNASGLIVTKAVKAFPAWEKSWSEILKIGTPLLNEVLFLYNNPNGAFCLIPVVSDKEIIALVFCPLDSKENYGEITMIGEPLILKGEAINTDLMARGFLQSDCYKKLSDKGYKCSVKLTPLSPPEVHVRTKSSYEYCILGVDTYSTIYFSYDPGIPNQYETRMYACQYAFNISIQELEYMYNQYFIDYYSTYFMYQFEYIYGEYTLILDPIDVYESWKQIVKDNAESNVEGYIDAVFSCNEPIHECISHGVKYDLSLTANPLAGGYVLGEGSYLSGSPVMIAAYHNSGFKFVNWTGCATFSTSSTTVNVDSTMYFIANFRPCFDTGKANPLGHMELAPPNPNKIKGATYGITRVDEYGNPKSHYAIDLAGAVGTPIYAQFDGTIAEIPVTEQPNRVAGYYPSGYSGDVNDGGNRIFVDSNVGGNTVRNGYMHLQAGNPVATNPRTGQPFTTGNTIYAGEVIGYIGHTGNASASRPHLHLKTTVNGALANPADYFNATVSTTVTTITTPCD